MKILFFCGPQIMTVHPSSKLRQHAFFRIEQATQAASFHTLCGMIGNGNRLDSLGFESIFPEHYLEKHIHLWVLPTLFPQPPMKWHLQLAWTGIIWHLSSPVPPLFPSRLPIRLHDPLHLLPAMRSNESRRVAMAIRISQEACRKRLRKSRVEVIVFSR